MPEEEGETLADVSEERKFIFWDGWNLRLVL